MAKLVDKQNLAQCKCFNKEILLKRHKWDIMHPVKHE